MAARSEILARRRRVTIGCSVAALLLHAAIGWTLLRAAAPKPPRSSPAQPVLAVRWLRASAPPATQPPAPVARERAVAHGDAARAPPPRRTPVPAPQAAPPPGPAPVPIDGSVFALPRISYGDAAPARGVGAFGPSAAAAPPLPSGGHDALRRQIADHIQRQLAALPAPPADGRCTLSGASEPQWSCDSDLLNAALGDHAAPLARLVAAHQRSTPGTEPAVVESRAGQFRLLLP